MSKLTGAEIVVECLKEQGVDTVFGYPGGSILNIYDALYQHQDEITHILTSHEQGAAHAADGYARATGKVGVCLATSGPGATNLVTGIATAYMDSVPVVAITCNVTNSLLGKDSFQEIDITGVTMPITKYNFIVKDVNRLAKVIRRAFTIAQTGRPGPVLVDITKDVTAAPCEYEKEEPEEIVRQSDTIREEDMERAIWFKYMCNVSENQSAAVLGISYGAWRVSGDANFIREALMREVIAVARKKGISLTEEDMEKQVRVLGAVPPGNKPSTLQDIEAGRRTEVEMFGGTMIRMGRELGVPTPYNEMFYHAIKVLEQKNEGLF